jgi:hypothetical protein
MKLFGTEISQADFEKRTGSLAQSGGILPLTYSDGRSNNVRGLRIDTGVFAVDLVVDRCLDIANVRFNGTPLMWRTANDIAAPSFYDDRGDGWLRSFFGGWMTTCGLSNFGPAGKDQWGTFGLHGRINNTPAESVATSTEWIDGRCTFRVSGIMRETKALGEVMVLYRTITTELGSSTLSIRDRVVNEGKKDSPHMLLYHCNAGWPLLDEATRVHITQSAMRSRDAAAEAGIAVWNQGDRPFDHFDEQVFVHSALACIDGKARAAIVNQAFGQDGIGFEIAYNPDCLPAIISWRMLEAGNYVMAIEPANTGAIEGRVFAQENNTLPILAPGEERLYELDFTVLEGKRLIESIQTIESTNATAAAQR